MVHPLVALLVALLFACSLAYLLLRLLKLTAATVFSPKAASPAVVSGADSPERDAPSRGLCGGGASTAAACGESVESTAERDGLFLCLASVTLGLASYALSDYVTVNPEYPRQLVFIYVPLFLALGCFLFRMVDLCGKRWGGRRVASAATLLVVAALASLNLVGLADLERPGTHFFYNRNGYYELQAFLHRNGISNVYTGYWTCYKLVFESGESIRASPLAGPVKTDRYQFYTEWVDKAERIAVVFEDFYPWSLAFMEEGLESAGIGYEKTSVGFYVIYWDFSRRPDIRAFNLPE